MLVFAPSSPSPSFFPKRYPPPSKKPRKLHPDTPSKPLFYPQIRLTPKASSKPSSATSTPKASSIVRTLDRRRLQRRFLETTGEANQECWRLARQRAFIFHHQLSNPFRHISSIFRSPPLFPPPTPSLSPGFKRTPTSLAAATPLSFASFAALFSTAAQKIADHGHELEQYLSCSLPGRNLKVAVLVSGGVHSSVALRLLHASGHSCSAFYLKIWFQEAFENFGSECQWKDDFMHAKAVCDQVGVPLEVVNLTDEYWEKVVSYMIGEYRCGRTPNPDVLCNTRIKFGAFMDTVSSMKFDYIASGHYANVVHPSPDEPDKTSTMELSKDMTKDQTYFLSHLSQQQLKRLMFPLGCATKDEVRKLASMFDLPNKDRKDSRGIGFLGKIKFSEFIARHIGEMKGIALEAETGDFIGKHRGFWFYTIGQRQGLSLSGGPWYVVEKDVKNNVVFVSRHYHSADKRRRTFRVGSFKWLSRLPPDQNRQLRCKVRHGPIFYDCNLTMEPPKEDVNEEVGVVHLSEDDQGLAAGQFVAFYHGNMCIGSGVILEACERALEIANLENKSKLGKPGKDRRYARSNNWRPRVRRW